MLCADIKYLAIVSDDMEELGMIMRDQLSFGQYGVIISTGVVSMEKFDFVREGIERLGAEVHFHKVAVRPGHPFSSQHYLLRGRLRSSDCLEIH